MKEKIWVGEALLTIGAALFIIGIMIYCRGAFEAEFAQREILVEGWGVTGFGSLLLLVGSFLAMDTDALDADF